MTRLIRGGRCNGDDAAAAWRGNWAKSEPSATLPIPAAVPPKKWRRVICCRFSIGWQSCMAFQQRRAVPTLPVINGCVEIENGLASDRKRGDVCGVEVRVGCRFTQFGKCRRILLGFVGEQARLFIVEVDQ